MATIRRTCLILAGLFALGLGPGAAVTQAEPRLVTGAGPGGGPHVRVFDGMTGGQLPTPVGSFFAYDAAFTGGVRVASCDLTGDGVPEVITGAGPGGGPHVRVFDGMTGAQLPAPLGSFFAYDAAFTGGVYVACGDVNGDGKPDIITGAGPGGGPHVRVFDGGTGAQLPAPLGSFFAYDAAFTGGVRVASCDLTGDAHAEIITGAGPGGAPHVRVFDGMTGAQLSAPLGSFFAYDVAFTGGVFVACGDVNGDTVPDVVTGAGAGGGPHVRVFDGGTGAQLPAPLGSFFAYDAAFSGGVRVASCDLIADTHAEVMTGAGQGGGPHVRVFDGGTGAQLPAPLGSFFAYDVAFSGGVHIACALGANGPPVNLVPGPQTTPENTPLAFSGANENLIVVTDPDAGTSPVQVTLTAVNGTLTLAGVAGLSFSVGDGTADATMTFSGTIDAINAALDGMTFTSPAAGAASLTITTSDLGHTGTGGPLSDTDTVDITVTTDAAPVVISTTPVDGATDVPLDTNLTVTFSEPVNLGANWFQIVCTTSGTRNVADTIVFGGPTTFTIDPNADFVLGDSCTVTIFAAQVTDQDVSDPPDTMAADFSFTFSTPPPPNTAPTVTPATFTTAENSPNGTAVGTVTFTDPDAGQSHTFAITAGNTGGAFAINASSGQITVATSGVLNFEATPSFSLTVEVRDTGTPMLSGSATITVNLTDVNEAPVVNPATFSLPENSPNGTPVGTVTFADPDAGQTGTFSITAGNTGGAFAINASSGQITVATSGALNFEATPSFSLTVQVTDNGIPALSGTATVTVNLTDVNEAPVVTPATFAVPENSPNGTVVGTVTFADPDAGQTGTFAITAGNTGGAFAINASTGQITVATSAALNFETTPSFSLTVQVTDNGAPMLSGSATVTVNLIDVNEAPLVNPATFSLPENSPNGTVVGTVTFTDPDVGQSHTFAITAGNTGGAFAINAGTGQITVATSAALNFETTPSFSLTVQVTDNGAPMLSGSATVTVNLTDANDPPVALAKNYSAQANMKISIPAGTGLLVGATDEDQTPQVLSIGTVSATTPAGGTVTFAAATGAFDFDPPPGATGNVTFTYTVCDDGAGFGGVPACSAATTVTFNVAGPVIWFVNSAGGAGNGRLSSPFNTLAAADAVDAANHNIFLFTGTYVTGLTLNSGERLIGQGVTGASFDAVFGISPPAGTIARPSINGTRPTVQGTVTLNTNSQVRGLNLSTGASTGLNDPAGAITGVTVSEVSVTTTTGTAVNLSGTGGTVSLTSVSANGAANGISLTNTTGSFTVTGNGPAGSGGTIQGSTGPGILMTTAQSVSLTSMVVQNGGDDGIRGTGVTGFILASSTISGNGNAVGEHGIDFTNLLGTASITDTTITGSAEHNLAVVNSSGTLTLLTITGTPATCQFTNTSAATGSDGILFQGNGTAAMSISVANCTFDNNRGDHFQATTDGASSATMDVVFQNNTLTGDGGITIPAGCTPGVNCGNDLGGGITINPGGTATLTFDVLNNTIQGATSSGITINNSAVGANVAVLSGTISGNTIGNPAVVDSGSSQGDGINVTSNGAGTTTVAVTNNQIHEYSNLAGIQIHQRDGDGTLNATISGNTISSPGTFASNGLLAQAGAVTGDQGSLCVDIGGAGANSLAGSGANGGTDFRVRQRILTTVQLPGYVGLNNADAAVILFIQGQNTGTETGSATNNVLGGGGGFVGGAACPQP